MTVPPAASTRAAGAARVAALVLLLAGAMGGLASSLGVATAADLSPVGRATAAAWTPLLPGLVALVLAAVRPVLGLAAVAGAGAIGLTRLCADLAVVVDLDAVVRPELFYETSATARPFAVGGGGWLLIAADLLTVAVGVVAAVRFSAAVSPRWRAQTEDDAAVVSPDAGSADGSAVALALSQPPSPRVQQNTPMILVGLLGAVFLLAGGLGLPYTGGYLDVRLLPAGLGLGGVAAAILVAVTAAVAVLIAAVLPRPVALALLGGTAVAAAVPALTAAVAVAAGAPTALSGTVWLTLIGAVVLVLAGGLAKGTLTAEPVDTAALPNADPPSALRWIGVGVAALLAAGLCAWASTLPHLYMDGAVQPALPGVPAADAPAGPPFLVAAIPIGLAGLLALLPPAARLGRAAVAVVWAGAVFALLQSLRLLDLVLASQNNPLNAELPVELQHWWTAGPGLWWGAAGTFLAVGAAVAAASVSRDAADAARDATPVDDGTVPSRTARAWVSGGLAVLALIALALPMFSVGSRRGPTLALADIDSWGVWAIGVAVVGALVGAAVTNSRSVAAALAVAAATTLAVRVFVPAATSAEDGYATGAGLPVTIAAIAALLAGAVVLAVLTGRSADERSASPPARAGGATRPTGARR